MYVTLIVNQTKVLNFGFLSLMENPCFLGNGHYPIDSTKQLKTRTR